MVGYFKPIFPLRKMSGNIRMCVFILYVPRIVYDNLLFIRIWLQYHLLIV